MLRRFLSAATAVAGGLLPDDNLARSLFDFGGVVARIDVATDCFDTPAGRLLLFGF